jgi:D-alanyl-D-alanine carboxypeptidase
VASPEASSLARAAARFLTAIVLSFAVLLPVIGAAEAASVPRKYAGIVVDAKTGKVLYESAADSLRYPASVTKVMTLYVLFQELAAGNLTLKTKMRVSKHAAAAVPTKLGLKAGATISVEDAIKALVTISANDIARVIAEHISGSESKFAERMTSTAKALGMKKTVYRNASGLPDKGQVTTVRDQSILAMAVYQHFPKYYEYFQTKAFKWGKRTYGNHNRLLGANGVDGIKTGYINASGYNLMTAARTDGKHVVVIGFGFDSASKRDSKIREQLKKYMPKARSGDYAAMVPVPGRKGQVVQLASVEVMPVTPAPFPTFRMEEAAAAALQPAPEVATLVDETDPEIVTASIIEAPIPAAAPVELELGYQPAVAAIAAMGGPTPQPVSQRPLDVIGAWIEETFELGAEPAPLGQTRPSAPLVPPVGVGDKGEPIDLMTSGSIPEPSVQVAAASQPLPPASSAPSGWIVQIGAAPTEVGANELLIEAASTVSALGDFRPFVERFVKNGQTFYRARFGGFGDRDDAADMCSTLKKAKMSCLAMQS